MRYFAIKKAAWTVVVEGASGGLSLNFYIYQPVKFDSYEGFSKRVYCACQCEFVESL
ncbi:hypothetical protein DENIT_10351 [Pseudomonas veronii]|nr:hypothetical protein DENIT_10351 [Pseudomonas veronii]